MSVSWSFARRSRGVSPQEALALQREGAVLIDVRKPEEIAAGTPSGALPLGRSYLEFRIEEAVPDEERTMILFCAVGQRSLSAADGPRRLGYQDVRNLDGGFDRWKNAGRGLLDRLPGAARALLSLALSGTASARSGAFVRRGRRARHTAGSGRAASGRGNHQAPAGYWRAAGGAPALCTMPCAHTS
jgi:rhodanese-related sulfurtransferase